MNSKIALFIFSFFLAQMLPGQVEYDTLKVLSLDAIQVAAQRNNVERLPQVAGVQIWAGKKNEVVNLQFTDANVAEKTPRQLFAKVPGVFVYDMDGTGNQINIATRGLDPHRGWEFNIRKNGVITNTDIYGYPASHFSLPMEAVEHIELVRGTGALQYGAQFGGMLNYVLKQPDTTKTIGFETVNSIGSFGLLSTYNAVGGKVGKLIYSAWFSKRGSDGYRKNSRSDFDGQGVSLKWLAADNLALTAEFARSNYVYQLPGALTDSMFHENPRQATRSRNYYSPEIYIPSLRAEWHLGEKTHLMWMVSAVLGDRSSVLFDKPANVPDALDPNTFAFAPRQVDVDNYHSYTSELRLLQNWSLGKKSSALALGVQYFNNDLHRRQLGKGTTGSDFDLTISADGWGRDLHLKTQNVAFFAENLFRVTPKFSLSPGVRVEMGASKVSGKISYLPDEHIPNTIEHRFPLFGVSADYQINALQNLYAGWSQAYRPVIFKDIIPGSLYDRVDEDLRDAKGYNFEIGYRGTAGGFRWDASFFALQYNNRLGSQALEENGTFYLFRTNIGDSRTYGVEFFAEYGFKFSPSLRCNIFTSTAFMDARYEQAQIRSGNENKDISGNRVESVPEWISRNGLNLRYKKFSISALYSYTGESFADPMNTEKPSANGAVGLVPAYSLLDLNATWRVANAVVLRFSLNNLTDRQYFTKRPTFYPGPGVWSSDGRSANVSIGVKI